VVHTIPTEPPTDAKQRILDAAARMFAERGYAATAMQDLATDLGLTRAALYYHYPAKADILQGIIDAETARFTASMDAVAALTSRTARIEATIEALVASALNQRRRIVFLVAEPAGRTLPGIGDSPDFFHRIAEIIYRTTPTSAQLWAVNAAFMSFAALPSFANLSDEDLVPILTGALSRLLRTP
jgi:AcrR family transcriptional regulator